MYDHSVLSTKGAGIAASTSLGDTGLFKLLHLDLALVGYVYNLF